MPVLEPELASCSGERVPLQQALHGSLIPVDLVVTSQSTCNELCQGPGIVEFPAPREVQVLHESPYAVPLLLCKAASDRAPQTSAPL